MILIKDLNEECKKRKAANNFPSQIICRLLGNNAKACQLNKICEESEKKGLWYLYTVVILFLILIYSIAFWILRLTKLSKIIYPILMLFIVPLEWLATCMAATIQFIRKLPF